MRSMRSFTIIAVLFGTVMISTISVVKSQDVNTVVPEDEVLVQALPDPPSEPDLPSEVQDARDAASSKRDDLSPDKVSKDAYYEEGAAHDQEEEQKVFYHLHTDPDLPMPPEPAPKMPKTPEEVEHEKQQKIAEERVKILQAKAKGEAQAEARVMKAARVTAAEVANRTKAREHQMEEDCDKAKRAAVARQHANDTAKMTVQAAKDDAEIKAVAAKQTEAKKQLKDTQEEAAKNATTADKKIAEAKEEADAEVADVKHEAATNNTATAQNDDKKVAAAVAATKAADDKKLAAAQAVTAQAISNVTAKDNAKLKTVETVDAKKDAADEQKAAAEEDAKDKAAYASSSYASSKGTDEYGDEEVDEYSDELSYDEFAAVFA